MRFATDRETGELRGFGHVEFTTLEASKKAIEKTGTDVCGRPIRVDYAAPRAEGGGGGGGRGGFGGTCCFNFVVLCHAFAACMRADLICLCMFVQVTGVAVVAAVVSAVVVAAALVVAVVVDSVRTVLLQC